jgi:hypothetical protein
MATGDSNTREGKVRSSRCFFKTRLQILQAKQRPFYTPTDLHNWMAYQDWQKRPQEKWSKADNVNIVCFKHTWTVVKKSPSMTLNERSNTYVWPVAAWGTQAVGHYDTQAFVSLNHAYQPSSCKITRNCHHWMPLPTSQNKL